MCVLSYVFLTGSPRRFVPLLRRTRNAARSQEKKPAKFANGSLLGNDSRIFVQHHGAYPLTRMRLSLPQLPRRFPSAHFSFSKFYRPEMPAYFIPSLSTLPFLRSLILPPPAMTLCTLNFVCVLYFLSFTYHLDFCNNNHLVPPRLSCFPYTRLSRFFFRFYVISISFISRFCYVLFLCPSRSFVHSRRELFFISCQRLQRAAARRYRLPE